MGLRSGLTMYPDEVFPDASPKRKRTYQAEFPERVSNYAESSASGAARRPESRIPTSPHPELRRNGRIGSGDPQSLTLSRRIPCKFYEVPSGRSKPYLDWRHSGDSASTCRFMHPGDTEWKLQVTSLPQSCSHSNVRAHNTNSATVAAVKSHREDDDFNRGNPTRRRTTSPSRRTLESDRRDRDHSKSTRHSAANDPICKFYTFPTGAQVTKGVNCKGGSFCRDVHPQDPEWNRRLDEHAGRPPGTTKTLPHTVSLTRHESEPSASKGQGVSIPNSAGRTSHSRENSISRPMTPVVESPRPHIPPAHPPPPDGGPLPPPTPQSSLSDPPRISQPSSPPEPSRERDLDGKHQISAASRGIEKATRAKRKATVIEFTEVLQAVLVAQTKLNIAQKVVKRAGLIYTSGEVHHDDDLIRDIYRDESNAKAELKAAHERFDAVYDSLLFSNAFDESADNLLATVDARLGITDIQQRVAGLERTASIVGDTITALQTRGTMLQAAVEALQVKFETRNTNEAPRVDAAEIIPIVNAELDKRQADVVVRVPDPLVKQTMSVPPSPLPSPPASGPAEGTNTRPAEDGKRGRARQVLQGLVDRVDILETEQSISAAEIDGVRDTVNDFMSDCASVTKGVLRKMMRDSTDQSRETLATELRNIIRLVNGEGIVSPTAVREQPAELAVAPMTTAEVERLQSEVQASLKTDLKAELMAELKAQIKEELKEETKAEIRAEVKREYSSLLTELQEKVEFLETGMSSQISSMYQEFTDHRNSLK